MSRFHEDQLREVFDEIDLDKNGYINRSEVLHVLKKLDLNDKEVKEYTDVGKSIDTITMVTLGCVGVN